MVHLVSSCKSHRVKLRWENSSRLIFRSYFHDSAEERKAWIVGFCFMWAKINLVEARYTTWIGLYANITDYELTKSLVRHVTSSLILKIYLEANTKAQAQIRMLFKVLNDTIITSGDWDKSYSNSHLAATVTEVIRIPAADGTLGNTHKCPTSLSFRDYPHLTLNMENENIKITNNHIRFFNILFCLLMKNPPPQC